MIREEITVQTRLFQGYYQILTFLPCHHLLNFLESAPFVECAQLCKVWRIKMYAVIKSGGKQYKVEKGDKLKVEKIDAEAGKDIKIDDVLMLVDGENVTVGTPLVKGAKVSATVESHGRGPKIKIVKFRRRKHHRKQMGHRQAYTEISITEIAVS